MTLRVCIMSELGYRMPAEWEPHEATWIAWPHEPEDWPGKFSAIPWVFAEIVRQLQARECVRIIVEGEPGLQKARRVLKAASALTKAVEFLPISTDRCWLRDSG